MFASEVKKTLQLLDFFFPVPFLTSDLYNSLQGSLGTDPVIGELFWALVNESFIFIHISTFSELCLSHYQLLTSVPLLLTGRSKQ